MLVSSKFAPSILKIVDNNIFILIIALVLVRATDEDMNRNLSPSENQLDKTEQKSVSGILGLVPFGPFGSSSPELLVLLAVSAVIVLATIALAILRGYQLWKWITTSNAEDENMSVPDSSAEQTRSTGSVDQLITDGNQAIEANKQAYRNNEYRAAVESLSNAIDYYQAAIDRISNPNKIADLEETIADAKAEKRRIESITTVQTAVKEALQTGERNFKEAIARYAVGNQTVARIRFRQARDAYEEARQTIENSEIEMFAEPIEVSFEEEATLPSIAIEELAAVDDATLNALSAVDVESLTDIGDDTDEITPAVLTDMHQNGEISVKEATLLTVLSWWYEGNIHVFFSKKEISQRYKKANYGFDQST